MLIFTTESIPGVEFELLGLAQGTTVRAKHIGHDFMAGIKSLARDFFKKIIFVMILLRIYNFIVGCGCDNCVKFGRCFNCCK